MDKPVLQIDIAIIGGGIAGLWALNQLRGSGYSAVLFEHDALGGDQTAASQGILHSGIKYNLSDALQGDADSMSAMPAGSKWIWCPFQGWCGSMRRCGRSRPSSMPRPKR